MIKNDQIDIMQGAWKEYLFICNNKQYRMKTL